MERTQIIERSWWAVDDIEWERDKNVGEKNAFDIDLAPETICTIWLKEKKKKKEAKKE